MAYVVKIENGCEWLYDSLNSWKEYISSNFDENVVIYGNRDYKEHKNAAWYNDTYNALLDLDCYLEEKEFFDQYEDQYGREKLEKFVALYNKYKHIYEAEYMVDFINILYPELQVEYCCIRGYCQSEWNDCIITKEVDSDILEDYYFGKIRELFFEDENNDCFSNIIRDSELWKLQRENGLKKYLEDIAGDTISKVYEESGYHTVKDFSEVEI